MGNPFKRRAHKWRRIFSSARSPSKRPTNPTARSRCDALVWIMTLLLAWLKAEERILCHGQNRFSSEARR